MIENKEEVVVEEVVIEYEPDEEAIAELVLGDENDNSGLGVDREDDEEEEEEINDLAADEVEEEVVKTAKVNVNIRTSPWGSVVGVLSKGATVTIVGMEEDWAVTKNGNYILDTYLK